MIRSIEIKGLRGIREGKLDDLAPLTILVGPNGSGKSTVLDALNIATNPIPADAISLAIQRRVGLQIGGRWLLWRAGKLDRCTVALVTDSGGGRTFEIVKEIEDYTLTVSEPAGPKRSQGFHLNPAYQGPREALPFSDISEVCLLDALLFNQRTPLHKLWTKASVEGQRKVVTDIIREVLPQVDTIEILTEGDSPVVHLVFEEYSIPVAMAGDGIDALLRLALELATRSKGLVLLEEPEVHQHPGAMRQSAKAILAAARRDIQVVLSTHSLEFIDAILAAASEEDLEKIAVFRVTLKDGILKSFRRSGSEALVSHSEIGNDLR